MGKHCQSSTRYEMLLLLKSWHQTQSNCSPSHMINTSAAASNLAFIIFTRLLLLLLLYNSTYISRYLRRSVFLTVSSKLTLILSCPALSFPPKYSTSFISSLLLSSGWRWLANEKLHTTIQRRQQMTYFLFLSFAVLSTGFLFFFSSPLLYKWWAQFFYETGYIIRFFLFSNYILFNVVFRLDALHYLLSLCFTCSWYLL